MARHGTLKDVEARLPYVAVDGIRRVVSAADSSDRPLASQGPEQRADGAAGRRRQPVGHRLRRKAATSRFIRSWARWKIFAGWWRRPSSTASSWRWTSRSSPRPIIRTCASIPNGFANGPTARFNTPRIRRRSIRTFIRSTSRRDAWQVAVAGAEERVSSSGSTRACGSFASTTRTPSRLHFGSG